MGGKSQKRTWSAASIEKLLKKSVKSEFVESKKKKISNIFGDD